MFSIIFQILQIASNYGAAWCKNKKHIMAFKILSAIFNSLAILSIGNIAGAIPVLFTVVRSIVCFYKDRFKTNYPIWLCVLGYIIIGLLTIEDMRSIVDALPLITSLIASLIIWYCNPVKLKLGMMLPDGIWLIYHISSGLYLSAANLILQTIVSIISIIRIKLSEQRINDKQ